MVKGNITRCSVCDDERSFALTIDYTTISDCISVVEGDMSKMVMYMAGRIKVK
jgi:hypothetical protein